MKFTLVFVVSHKDGRVTDEVVAVGECADDMLEVFEEMPYSRYVHYECRPYNGEKLGDVIERAWKMYPACEKCKEVDGWVGYYTCCSRWRRPQCDNEDEAEKWVNSERYERYLAELKELEK